jgi:glycine cleavage system H protein
MNTDPYGDGWLIEVRPATVGDVDALLTAADYQDLVEKGH